MCHESLFRPSQKSAVCPISKVWTYMYYWPFRFYFWGQGQHKWTLVCYMSMLVPRDSTVVLHWGTVGYIHGVYSGVYTCTWGVQWGIYMGCTVGYIHVHGVYSGVYTWGVQWGIYMYMGCTVGYIHGVYSGVYTWGVQWGIYMGCTCDSLSYSRESILTSLALWLIPSHT